jgi:hypothetical protein
MGKVKNKNAVALGKVGGKKSAQSKLEKFWNGLTSSQERKLKDYFNAQREVFCKGITKDNCDTLFDLWSEKLTLKEINQILKK